MNISFKKYKPFADQANLDLKKFNLVIGQNSSGKTSLTDFIKHYVDFATKGIIALEDLYILTDLTDPKTFGSRKIHKDDLLEEEKRALMEYGDVRNQSDLDDLENRKIFPKYYNMSNLEKFNSETVYDLNSKHLFNFKFNPNFLNKPSAVTLSYKTLCSRDRFVEGSMRARARRFRQWGSMDSLIQNPPDSPEHDLPFDSDFRDNQSIPVKKFINFLKDQDSILLNQPHPSKRGTTTHKTNVRVSNKMIKYSIESKRNFGYLLNGLNIVKDRNENQSISYFSDGSKLDKELKNAVNNLSRKVFKPVMEFIEDKFSDYKKSYNKLYPDEIMPEFPLTMPLMIDTSKYDFSDSNKKSGIEKFVEQLSSKKFFNNALVKWAESSNNLWNISPYVFANYFKKEGYGPQRRSSCGVNEVLPHFRNIASPLRRGVFSGSYRIQGTDYIRMMNQDYDDNGVGLFEYDLNEDNFTDFDFYKDFTLTKRTSKPKTVLRHLNAQFNAGGNRCIQPACGVFFSISDPTIRKGTHKKLPVVKRDVISDVKEIKSFLKEVGYMPLLKDFKDFKESTKTGNIQTFKFTGRYALHYQNLMSPDIYKKLAEGDIEYSLYQYQKNFSYAIKKSSLFFERGIKQGNIKNIQKVAKKYGVTKNAVLNQIEIIRMYLFRLTLVQFQMNISKYLYSYYYRRLLKFNIQFEPNTTIGGEVNLVSPQLNDDNSVFHITPNNGEIFKKYNDSRVKSDDLIKFFGERTREIFTFDKEVDIRLFKLKINRFCSFVNANLLKLNLDFKIKISPESYQNDDIIPNVFSFTIIENQSMIGLPVFNRGTGDSLIISLIGNLYNFNILMKTYRPVIIIREPEVYLHPTLIENIIEYLFKFANSQRRDGLKFVIESHSETVLRTIQKITKEAKPEHKDVGIYYVEQKRNKHGKRIGSIIKDLEIQDDGFLGKEVPKGFFAVNTNLIEALWK